MENRNNKGLRTMAIAALLLAVVGISVAFAALSQTLQINTEGTLIGGTWDIKWTAASGAKNLSLVNVEVGNATVPAVNLEISGIKLEKPGDKVEWTIKAENLGTIDAILSSFNNVYNVQIVTDPEEESSIKAADILVTLTKKNGSAISVGDTLAHGSYQEYLLTVEFDNSVTYIPSHDVEITIQTISFPWIQK